MSSFGPHITDRRKCLLKREHVAIARPKNGGFDFEKCASCLENMKAFLAPNLENRIHSGLEEFVYKQNSRYAKQFPYLKRCLDVAIGWGEPLDAFCAKYEGTDIKKEMIKQAIEYLIKDSLVTYIVDSVVLNKRLDRVCRELDSLGIQQNFLRPTNFWSFVNEKDYSSCPKCSICSRSIHEVTAENYSSDLDVEIGSDTKEPSTFRAKIRKRPASHDSFHRFDRTEPREVQCHREDSSNTFRPKEETLNSLKNNSNVFDGFKVDSGKRNKPRKPRAMLTYKTKRSKINWKDSRLKMIIYKTRADRGRLTPNLLKVSRLPLPCKPSHLIVQIFEAAPSLSESCLIVMRRKFENNIYNACSCLNNVLSKLDGSVVKKLRLNCEIRPGHVNIKLQSGSRAKSRVCFFVARIPICRNVHKRSALEQSARNVSCDSSTNRQERTLANETEECKMQLSNFHSPCSNPSSKEKSETEVEFAFSSCLKTDVENNKRSLVRSIKNRGSYVERVNSNVAKLFYSNNEEEESKEFLIARPAESLTMSRKSEFHEEQLTAEHSENKVVQCDSNCARSPDDIENGRENKRSSNEADSKHSFDRVFYINNLLGAGKQRGDDSNRDSVTMKSSEEKQQLDESELAHSTENVLNAKEEHDAESNRSSNSKDTDVDCDSKCSCCGKDLSNVAHDKETNIEFGNSCSANVLEDTSSKLEIREAPSAISPEEIEETKSKNFSSVSAQTSATKMISKGVNIDTHYQSVLTPPSSDKNPPGLSRTENCKPDAIADLEKHGIAMNLKESLDTQELSDNKRRESDIALDVSNVKQSLFKWSMSTRRRSSAASSKEHFRTDTHEIRLTSRTQRPRGPSVEKSKFQRARKPRHSICFTARVSSNSFEAFHRIDSVTEFQYKTELRRDDNNYSTFLSYKNRARRRSIVSRNFHSSFPGKSIDRIKSLIRGKLRKVLFDRRERGTNTSRTFLKNDRYLARESSCTSYRSSCSSCLRSYSDSIEPFKTFASEDRNFTRRKKEVFHDCTKNSRIECSAGGREIFQNISIVEASDFLNPKRRQLNDRKLNNKQEQGYVKERNLKKKVGTKNEKNVSHTHDRDLRRQFLRISSSRSTEVLFIEDNASFTGDTGAKLGEGNVDKTIYKKSCYSREQKYRNQFGCSCEEEHRLSTTCSWSSCGRKQFREAPRSKSNAYDESVHDLGNDFRLKLLQYVALCKSVKNSLIKRLRPDDVYDVSATTSVPCSDRN